MFRLALLVHWFTCTDDIINIVAGASHFTSYMQVFLIYRLINETGQKNTNNISFTRHYMVFEAVEQCFWHNNEQHGGTSAQETVQSPFLCTLCTSEFRNYSQSCHLQKFLDGSAIVGCIRYKTVVHSFVVWCDLIHLQLNNPKANKLVVDFAMWRTHLNQVSIRETDTVEEYKYLDTHIDNFLSFMFVPVP